MGRLTVWAVMLGRCASALFHSDDGGDRVCSGKMHSRVRRGPFRDRSSLIWAAALLAV